MAYSKVSFILIKMYSLCKINKNKIIFIFCISSYQNLRSINESMIIGRIKKDRLHMNKNLTFCKHPSDLHV